MTTVDQNESTKKFQPPAHLNEEYLRQVLEKTLSRPLDNVDYNYELASSNGENYCSNIYRIKLRYCVENEVHETAWVVKDMLMDIAEIGTNEVIMYQEILPAMELILQSMGSKEVRFGARCFDSVCRKEYEFYILEDLNALGYHLGNRYEGLNLQQTKVTLRKIAKFHAASMIYARMHPESIAKLGPCHLANGAIDPVANTITKGGIQYAANLVGSLPEFDETARKIRLLGEKFDEKIIEILKIENSAFNVLNHGDVWVNNILFKETKDTEVEDVVFVDFQNTFWGSPAIDLHFFLYTSVPLEILQCQRYEILRHYYTTLKSTLQCYDKRGELKIPTWSMFQKEIRRCALMGFNAAVCELPICSMTPETAKNFSVRTFTNPEKMEEKRKMLHTNKRAFDTLIYVAQYFEEIGLFDEL